MQLLQLFVYRDLIAWVDERFRLPSLLIPALSNWQLPGEPILVSV